MGKATTQRKGDTVRAISLPADFRIAALDEVKASLVEALDVPAVQIDGAAVERVDTAALQLLVAYRREAVARGQAPAWQGASAAMREAAAVLGLVQALELPATTPA
ncbi:lipid asymmetry maintenance protein MlaB [Dyella sp. C9]|uniref:STAS domain-containing protein n=1 Tax=Dyella sp. C9 TaxID=2202154 RepID=UPI000DF0069E|nr:STAS domain-containing protein [Dyella sp. C9]